MVRFARDVEAWEVTRTYEFVLRGGPFDASIHEGVAEYGFPFVTTVEVFYYFANGRLADVGVRKTTDAF